VGQQVQLQASFLAHMDASWALMLLAFAAVPLALSLRKVRLGVARQRGIEADLTIEVRRARIRQVPSVMSISKLVISNSRL
jgi:hypothetical protein